MDGSGTAVITERLHHVRAQIAQACASCAPVRSAGEVSLLAVTKLQSASLVRAAHAAGMREFGENYVREAGEKAADTADLPGSEWHLVGTLQSNKASAAARIFSWVHSISSIRIARRLGEARLAAELPDLNVCVQVNLGAEPGKSGAAPGEVADLCAAVSGLPGLRLRGLMCIPEPGPNARERFAHLRELKDQSAQRCPGLDTLSMGMSADYGEAVAEGATIIRLGTALFGPRPAKKAAAAR